MKIDNSDTLLAEIIRAHGGMELWQQTGSVSKDCRRLVSLNIIGEGFGL